MKYSLDRLTTEIEKGAAPSYLFFWGHTAKNKDIIDKSCFSQWWIAPFIVDGISYQTAEHWMMAKKALLFNDRESFDLIIQAETAAVAKQLGRTVKNFDPVIWESAAYDLVVEGNRHKFSQRGALKNFLLETGDQVIVEASPLDLIWGIGLQQDDENAAIPFNWKGTNLLGFALMEARDLIKNSNGKTT